MSIIIDCISKKFDEIVVLTDFCAVLPDTGLVFLKGASGIGKTTLLRIIAGLEMPDSGDIEGLENKVLSYAFQEDRLLKHLSALKNISLVSDEKTAAEWLNNFMLLDEKNKKPPEMSGGMCRRVALARAFAMKSDILLLDEPFKGLDTALKNHIARFINEYAKTGLAVLVSHENCDLLNPDAVINLA